MSELKFDWGYNGYAGEWECTPDQFTMLIINTEDMSARVEFFIRGVEWNATLVCQEEFDAPSDAQLAAEAKYLELKDKGII